LSVIKEEASRVLDNRVLRSIFGPMRDEVRGEWRKLRDKEINDLYSTSNIIRVIKSRRMRSLGHVGGQERSLEF
jgi:hypothetical protein